MLSKRFLYSGVFLFLLVVLLSSCGSKQKVVLPPNFKGPKELSRLYGVRITPDDNIYLYNAGAHWLGVPHRLGGMSKRGIDCSGFVSILYNDLVFFQTGRGKKKTPNHVGIYLKNGRFIHVSTSRGVMVSRLDEPYYMRPWITGGRVK